MNRTYEMACKARDLCVRFGLEPPFQPRGFVAKLAESMDITILLIPFPMVKSAMGYVLRVTERDYFIFYEPDVSSGRTIYHECGHIILNHVPISTRDELDTMLRSWSSTRCAPGLFHRRNRFGLPMELDAEGFSLALTALGSARASSPVPRIVTSEVTVDAALAAISRFYDDIGF